MQIKFCNLMENADNFNFACYLCGPPYSEKVMHKLMLRFKIIELAVLFCLNPMKALIGRFRFLNFDKLIFYSQNNSSMSSDHKNYWFIWYCTHYLKWDSWSPRADFIHIISPKGIHQIKKGKFKKNVKLYAYKKI